MFIWPPSFAVPRSYLDQLVRNSGIAADRATAIAGSLNQAEKMSGQQRTTALNTLATQLDGDAQTATDAARVKAMATAVRDLASGQNISTAAR
jgi:hypothetical protein